MGIFFRNSILLLLASFLWACSADISSDQHVTDAKRYLSEGKQSAAVIELKNALQQDANHQEARWLLGEAYFNDGQYANANKELTRARELGRSDDDVLPLLAQVLLVMGDTKRLQQFDATGLSDTARSFVLASQGIGLLRSGAGPEEAEKLIDQAIAASNTAYALEIKARLIGFSARGDWLPVRQQLNKVFDVDPNYAPAWSLLGDIEIRSLNIQLAEEAYTKAINSSDTRLEDYYKRALVRLQMENLDGAKEDIGVLAKRSPKSLSTQYLQGIIFFRDGNIKEAITAFDMSKNDENRYPMSLFYLAMANNMEGNTSQAEDYAYRFLSIAPDNEAGRKLLAAMKLKQGDAKEAESLVRPVVEKNQDDISALNMLASALLKQGKTEEGIGLLTKVTELQPESPEAKAKLGAGLLASGDVNRGLEYLESALKLDPSYEGADLLLMSALLKKGDIDGALAVVDRFEEKSSNKAIAHGWRGQIYLAANRIDDAKASFNKALELSPGDPAASGSLAFLAIKEQNFDVAKKYYKTVLEHNPNHLSTLVKLAALAEVEKNRDEMLKWLTQAVETHPKDIQPRVLLSRFYLTEGRPEQVPVLVTALEPSLQETPDVLNVMGLSYLQRGEFADAKLVFQKLTLSRPDAPQPFYHLGVSTMALGERDNAQKAFISALDIAPSYIEPRIEVTRFLLSQKDRDAAVKHLAILKKLAPENADVLQLDAVRARLDGDQNEALALSAKAFENAPTSQNMLVLAQQNWAMGHKQASQKILETWVAKHPGDVSANLELADLHLAEGEEKKAGERYKEVLAVQENNPLALNNLAWLLRDSDPKMALVYAEKAVELSANSAAALDTLAVVLLNNNQKERAQRTIERALDKNDTNASIKYHSAMINVAIGDKQKAKGVLESILTGDAVFPERKEAEALLKTL